MSILHSIRKRFERKSAIVIPADFRMISGCKDAQTSADVFDVSTFALPSSGNAGRKAGGACTSALLRILYAEHTKPKRELTFVDVLKQMRDELSEDGYTQIPQLTSSKPVDVNLPFHLVPEGANGTRRAFLIGINYIGQMCELSGCHNDVLQIKEYIMDIHGFKEENITVLMDDGKHEPPTRKNIVNGYKKVVAASFEGDSVFCHFSGHASQLKDDDWGEEEDGLDETLVPVDYRTAGQIRDDDLFDIFVHPMPHGVTVTCLMDCCHSGTVLDLPYVYKADSKNNAMGLDQGFNFGRFFGKIGKIFEKDEDDDVDHIILASE